MVHGARRAWRCRESEKVVASCRCHCRSYLVPAPSQDDTFDLADADASDSSEDDAELAGMPKSGITVTVENRAPAAAGADGAVSGGRDSTEKAPNTNAFTVDDRVSVSVPVAAPPAAELSAVRSARVLIEQLEFIPSSLDPSTGYFLFLSPRTPINGSLPAAVNAEVMQRGEWVRIEGSLVSASPGLTALGATKYFAQLL